jgi:8-oxo-dGTP pyrophosphatase MutT (NUDIX family)
MMDATLCLLVRGDPPAEMLLGLKKSGFGAGKYNGFGGKVEPGETIVAAAVREVAEEVGVSVREEDLRLVARLAFLFAAEPALDRVAHVFLTAAWDGEPVESSEMAPRWFALDAIPYGQMWQGDIHWLPRVLAGERIQGSFTFGADNETVSAWELEQWDDRAFGEGG